jgi:hypothetical protein
VVRGGEKAGNRRAKKGKKKYIKKSETANRFVEKNIYIFSPFCVPGPLWPKRR